MHNWNELIFSGDIGFKKKLEMVFGYQFENNPVYRRYCEALRSVAAVSGTFLNSFGTELESESEEFIPLLPIRAFKEAEVTTRPGEEHELLFKSSGTSVMQRSVHKVYDKEFYRRSLLTGFRQFYDLDSSVIWGYTPGYADNPNSSLIYMIKTLIEQDESGLSRFLPLNEPLDKQAIEEVAESGLQLILFGAAFGLLDLLETEQVELPPDSIVIETGGMKTHRREMSRDELHHRLADGFGLDGSRIHSEYGMAELLSQAYTTGGSWFQTVPWMQVSIRNPENPFEEMSPHQEGLIGVIDLANVYSCPFVLTGDKGVMDGQGRFEVMGRWNPKDLRGCNFLIEED